MMPSKRFRRPDGTYLFASETFLKAFEEGRQEARVETRVYAIFKVLDVRGIEVDGDSRAVIESCRDADVLDTWLRRSGIIANASDLFA